MVDEEKLNKLLIELESIPVAEWSKVDNDMMLTIGYTAQTNKGEALIERWIDNKTFEKYSDNDKMKGILESESLGLNDNVEYSLSLDGDRLFSSYLVIKGKEGVKKTL